MQPRTRTQRLGLPASKRYAGGAPPPTQRAEPPGPRAARSLGQVLGVERIGLLLLAAAALLWPLFTPKVAHFYGTLSATYALVGLSLVILVGWTGQISLG